MASIDSPSKLFIGIIFAMPPYLGNLAHELIDVLAVTAHSSFVAFSSILKITIIVYGYYLILISFLQMGKTPQHKVHKYSKNPKY